MGHFIHFPHVGHLHVIAHAQWYCFLSNLYNSELIGQLSSSRSARRPLALLCHIPHVGNLHIIAHAQC